MLDFDNIDCAWKRAVADPENHPLFHMSFVGESRSLSADVLEELVKEEPDSSEDRVLSDKAKTELLQEYLKL